MKKQKFMRSDFRKYSKLGLRRKNKQKYRKGKGLDNKLRLKMKGHLRNVDSGFRSKKETRDLIDGMKPVSIFNIKDLMNIKEGEIGVIAKIGNKNKMEIANYALKNNIKLANLNSKTFLEKLEINLKKVKEIKEKRNEKRKLKDKKAKEKAEKEKKKEEAKKNSEDKKEEKKTSLNKEETNLEEKKTSLNKEETKLKLEGENKK